MEKKKASCPNCGRENMYDKPSALEALAARMPAALAGSVGVKAIGAKSPGLGVVAGGLVLAYNVIRYLDGVSVTCGSCGYEYKVHHDDD